MNYEIVIPVLISFAISAILGPIVIPFLKRLKVGQTERKELESHLKKNGTPTMGGLMILASIIIIHAQCLCNSLLDYHKPYICKAYAHFHRRYGVEPHEQKLSCRGNKRKIQQRLYILIGGACLLFYHIYYKLTDEAPQIGH